jgi:hypothetical protein
MQLIVANIICSVYTFFKKQSLDDEHARTDFPKQDMTAQDCACVILQICSESIISVGQKGLLKFGSRGKKNDMQKWVTNL